MYIAVSCSVDKPNVILILTDDQGYGDLGVHDNPYVKTPNLDKLYENCVRFTDFHVDPCCSPTRAALLTGHYSIDAGVWHTIGGRSLLKEGLPTIADIFSRNGYETGIFGKWHLGENFPFRPQDRGFKESVVFGGGAISGNSPGYWGNDYFDGTYRHNGKFEKYEGYCNTVWFQEALKYIRKNREKPFFCFIATNLPHAPLEVEEKYSAPYKGVLSERISNYYGMVSKIDEDLGMLEAEIRNLGLEKNTILIFMTDNGPCPWFGGIVMDFNTGYPLEGYSAGMRGGKIWGYENAHRVPLFVQWPDGNMRGGKDINALSAHIDLMPTLIDLCKLKTPDNLTYDGKSLAPLLRGEIKEWPEGRTIITHNQRVEYPVKGKEYQVMTERWRLVKREKDELYDITEDPGQSNDIADQNPDIVKDLFSRYEKWWDSVAPEPDWYAEIYIGTEEENPVTLYSHDAHIRSGAEVWVVNIVKDGEYQVKVNRWPEESGKRIVENLKGDQELPVASAELTIGNISLSKEVKKDMTSADFIVNLKKGTTCIQTSFRTQDGIRTGRAECVYVKYSGKPDLSDLEGYFPYDPDNLLRKNFNQRVVSYD
jgi:arylsulfatase A-like enzyme